MSGYGTVAISGHEWLDERAQRVLNHGLPALPPMPQVRRFDPTEPRDSEGRWTDGPGGAVVDAAADLLDLAGRIHLGGNEKLVRSGKFEPSSGIDTDILFAEVSLGDYREVRFGFVGSEPEEWDAAPKPGETVQLTVEEVSQLHEDLESSRKQAVTAAKLANREWEAGNPSAISRGEEPAASGSFGEGDDRIEWSISLTDDEPVSWQLSIQPAGAPEDADPAQFTPKDLVKFNQLLKTLSG